MLKKISHNLREILAVYVNPSRLHTLISELHRILSAPRIAQYADDIWNTTLPSTDHPHNGSILRSGNAWHLAVRTANISYSKILRRLEVQGGPSCVDSKNWFLKLDDQFNICERELLDDTILRSQHEAARNGLTDPRLFEWQGGIWVLWSAERVTSDDWGGISNTMALGRIENSVVENFMLLPSPRQRVREKNWMPWVVDGELRIIYAPSNLEVYRVIHGNLELIHEESNADARLKGYSGSSQVHPWGEDWIFLVHYAARTTRTASAQLLPSFYLHRFVVITSEFKLKAISKEFFFEHKGTEFCAGLSITEDSFILSYGVGDRESHIMRIKINRVMTLFQH